MAEKKITTAPDGPKIEVVEVDGVEIAVDVTYVQSWPGIRKAVATNSSERTMEERSVAIVEYYERAIANIDDASAALDGKSIDEIVETFSKAVSKATSKN